MSGTDTSPEEDEALSARQREIERDLADMLIEARPDAWQRITLLIERTVEGLRVSISGPEGQDEPIATPPEFQRAVIALVQVFRERGVMLDRAEYVLRLRAGRWSCAGQFESSPQG